MLDEPRGRAQARTDQPEQDRHRQQADGHQAAGAHDEPCPRHLVHAASSISGHWPTVWAVARPDPDHRVNSPCSPRSANQAGASPSRSIPAVAATFAAVALAASAETAHQPVSALRPVRGSMRWCAGPGRGQPPSPALAAGRQPPIGDPDRPLGQPRDLVVRADDPARGRGDDPQVAAHVGDHVESRARRRSARRPRRPTRPWPSPRGRGRPRWGCAPARRRPRPRATNPHRTGDRDRRIQDRDVTGSPRAVPGGIDLAARGTGRPGRPSSRRPPGPPRPARRAASWPGPTVPAARLTPEISESARNRLATCSSRVDLVDEDLRCPTDSGRIRGARQGHGQRRAPALLHDLDGAHEVFDLAFGALAAGFGAAGAGATTVREGRGLGADRTAALLGGRLGPGRLDAGRALRGRDPDVDLAVDHDGLGGDVALLDPRDDDGAAGW